MADGGCSSSAVKAGCVLAVFCGLFSPGPARAEAPKLQLRAISQQTPGSCTGNPELDVRVEEELKQLTGRVISHSPAVPGNPTLTPAVPFQVFGGYIEPLDNDWWRARLWLKDAGTTQVAVRDTYYRNMAQLTAELPHDAAALILLPDWTRTGSALPQYCHEPAGSAVPEDACDPFLPPPSCGVAFDCTQSNQAPRCPPGPSCGVAGKPPCPPPPKPCRVRDWRFGTGIAALVAGGVAVSIGGLIHAGSSDGASPAAITSYAAGGALLGVGTGLMTHWGLRAETTLCNK